MLENFETVHNPLVIGGIIIFALCLAFGTIKLIIFMVKMAVFKPKRQPSVRERFELLTDHENRQKTGFERKYQNQTSRNYTIYK